jgi:hypothetical protein
MPGCMDLRVDVVGVGVGVGGGPLSLLVLMNEPPIPFILL